MNKKVRYSLLIGIIIVTQATNGFAQTIGQNSVLTPAEIENYTEQSRQLVKFTEYAFNSLGSNDVTPREKDVIIQQSFLKFFKSNKVQIEDDLIQGRFVVTNKDVQAYLKDIDFFFKEVVFNFYIEDITYNVNQNSQIFFVVKTQRTLTGISAEGEKIKQVQPRFIEINLDPDRRDLKIVSIYTQRLSEREDMKQWWLSLSGSWREILASNKLLHNKYRLADITNFSQNWIVLENRMQVTVGEYNKETRSADTIKLNAQGVFDLIRQIWAMESLDLSAYTNLAEITPLSKLTELRTLNISKTSVESLMPIRNLTRLETLDFSETPVINIESLRFAINLKNLFFNKSRVSSIATLQGLTALERLHLSNTLVNDLSPLSLLSNLRDLRIAQTTVSTLQPILALKSIQVLDISSIRLRSLEGLEQLALLERLHADYLRISDLGPLSDLANLQYLSVEGTEVNSLLQLGKLQALRWVYCDKTMIDRSKAAQLNAVRPGVLVVYESKALADWWQALADEWKNYLSTLVPVSDMPTREELHEIANITQIDISQTDYLADLEPLSRLTHLQKLNISGTSVSTLHPIKDNSDLIWLDASGTQIEDIEPLAALRNLQYLNVSATRIKNLQPISNNRQLKYLNLEKTQADNLLPLSKLSSLENLYCDGLSIRQYEIKAIYDANPGVMVVYRTSQLKEWWNSLNEGWQQALMRHSQLSTPPTRDDLHRLTDIHELDFSGNYTLKNLDPIIIFHRLRVLRINNTQTFDLKPVQWIETLEELYCANNPIRTFSPIRALPKLSFIDCSNTRISDLGDIGRLKTLQTLNISGTRVMFLSPLKDMQTLRHLDCVNTRVWFLNPLKNLKNLQTIKCYNTNISRRNAASFKRLKPDCEVIYY